MLLFQHVRGKSALQCTHLSGDAVQTCGVRRVELMVPWNGLNRTYMIPIT
jgi:hypothetical protein